MRRLAGALCVVVLAVFPGAAAAQVIPLADCVAEGSDEAHLQAWFGYRNLDSSALTIPPGSNNFFLPTPGFRGQPTVFMPGEFHRVFAVEFGAADRLTWILASTEAPADATLPSCEPRLTWAGQWDAAARYERNQIVAYSGSAWIAVHRSVNEAPGSGVSWELLVQKGETGAQGSPGERGQAGEPGAQGVEGPAGAPGVTPAFPASPILTMPRSGCLTVSDPNVQEDSVVVAVYVGGSLLPPAVIDIDQGRITILALPHRRVRYVVFK